jgi:hypothetical protein
MSPEQLLGDSAAIDERSDVWGLGAILYDVLTGRPPRSSASAAFVKPVRKVGPDIPTELAAICDKACALRREDRYLTAKAMAEDLDAWLHGRLVEAHQYGSLDLLRRFVGRNRAATAVTLLSVALLLGGGAAALIRVRAERNQARTFARLIIEPVLERLGSINDADFVASVTTTVTDWLQGAGGNDDRGAAAWAWAQLARRADGIQGATPKDRVNNCLRAAQLGEDVRARAAWLLCKTLEVAPADVDTVSSYAALRGLDAEAPPAGTELDLH